MSKPNSLGLDAMTEDERAAFANRCDAMRMAISIMLSDQMNVTSGKTSVEDFCGVIDAVATATAREKDEQERRRIQYQKFGIDPDEAGR